MWTSTISVHHIHTSIPLPPKAISGCALPFISLSLVWIKQSLVFISLPSSVSPQCCLSLSQLNQEPAHHHLLTTHSASHPKPSHTQTGKIKFCDIRQAITHYQYLLLGIESPLLPHPRPQTAIGTLFNL